MLNDEVLALRLLERFARLALAGAKLKADQADDLRDALAHLDAVREPRAKKNESGAAA